uniref:Serine aminopeptidase S33 domain-containing protein n=1 Tax=Cucumis melo TaxID=3656 RepID=A0A9I9CCA5_CUCME
MATHGDLYKLSPTKRFELHRTDLTIQPLSFFTVSWVQEEIGEWRVVLVDLRNHGKSAELEGFDPPHDMVNAAKDLAKLIESQDWAWPDVVMGHSMGGKVALQFLESCNRGDYGNLASLPKQDLPVRFIFVLIKDDSAEQLWVLDSVPGNVNPENSDGEVEKVLKTLQGLPSLVPSRK